MFPPFLRFRSFQIIASMVVAFRAIRVFLYIVSVCSTRLNIRAEQYLTRTLLRH